MGGRVKPGIDLRISYSDTMLNYQLSQKLKLLRNDEFNHLTINLTAIKLSKKEIKEAVTGNKNNDIENMKALA